MRPLRLTEEERDSALEVMDMLLDQADDLGSGALARTWRAVADELRLMCLESEDDRSADGAAAITCVCGTPAHDIGTHGLPVCWSCDIAEQHAILNAAGGLDEIRHLIEDHDSYAYCLLQGRALTVMDAEQLVASGELLEICGIGPKRAALIAEALRAHAAGRAG